jgi:hypothetical protein
LQHLIYSFILGQEGGHEAVYFLLTEVVLAVTIPWHSFLCIGIGAWLYDTHLIVYEQWLNGVVDACNIDEYHVLLDRNGSVRD